MNLDPKDPEEGARPLRAIQRPRQPRVVRGPREWHFPTRNLTFRKFKSRLQGHPECKYLPGVEISTGSLGRLERGPRHGPGAGWAGASGSTAWWAMENSRRATWEAIMAAGHRKTDNLWCHPGPQPLQIDGLVEEIKNEEPGPEKFAASVGRLVHHIDGHDYDAILSALRRPAGPGRSHVHRGRNGVALASPSWRTT